MAPLAIVVPLIPSDKRVRDIVVTDSNSIAFARHAPDVEADIDIITVVRGQICSSTSAQGRIVVAGGQIYSSIMAQGRVVVAGGEEKKRIGSQGCVVDAFRAMQQRIETNGGIEAAGGISVERLDADRRVESRLQCWQKAHPHQSAVLEPPRVFSWSALDPVAVLKLPSVLLRSA